MKPRPIRIEGDIAYVPLTKGYEAIIDAADVTLVGRFNWAARICRKRDGGVYSVYAFRSVILPDGTKSGVQMHRFLCEPPAGYDTDHADGNGLNNRRSNLRAATRSQNLQNARRRSDNTSGLRGVTKRKDCNRWQAVIWVNKKALYLGVFETKEAAHDAFRAAQAKHHGEFGRAA